METRKVQLSGGSTYTVSLPKDWADEHGIDADSQVFLHPQGNGTLHLSTATDEPADTWTQTTSAASRTVDQLRHRLQAMYVVGFDRITVEDATGLADEMRDTARQTAGQFSGFELLEDQPRRLTLQNLVSSQNLDIRKSTLRLRLVALAMHRDATTAVLERDHELAREVVDRDAEADRLFALLTRHFRRAIASLQEVRDLGYSRQEVFEYYYVSRQLERIADHAERIATLALDADVHLPTPVEDRFATLAERAQRHVEEASEVLLGTAGVDAADDVLAARAEAVSDINRLHRDLYDYDDAGAAHYAGRLLDSVQRTVEYAANIARLMIERAVRDSE